MPIVPRTSMSAALVAALMSVSPLPGQAVAEGYAAEVRPLPPGAGSVAVLPDGLVWFDGQDLVLQRGGRTRSLLHFPQPVFGSFTLPVAPDAVLFGESSQGDLWLVPLSGAASPRLLANAPLNFDALLYAPGLALVSAKTGGFAASRNDIVALDLHTGSVTPLVSVPGASGPLVQDAAANLYYATASAAFPPPPGGTEILRWPATRLLAGLGSRVWTEADAEVVHRGLDAASDLVLDGDSDLLFVDWFRQSLSELDDLGSGRAPKVLVDYAGASEQPAALQLLPEPGPGTFEPFQPAGGGRLAVLESAFGGPSRLRFLTPSRPTLQSDRPGAIPAGPWSVLVHGGPAGGTGLLAVHLFAAGREVAVPLAGFEAPLFWDLAMFGAPNTHLLGLDPAGSGALALTNPGVPGGLDLAVQAALLGSGGVLASTAPVTIRLDP